MNLDLVNNLFNNLKESKFVHNFMNELSNYLENNSKSNFTNYNNSLTSDDLTLFGNKIISKFKDEMLIERSNILQSYAENTKEAGEMYYIYDANERNLYNLCICKEDKSHEVITKSKEELPEGVNLGSVLRKQGEDFILDIEATKSIEEEINMMIQEKIEEQNEYLESKRIEGHIYEVGEKYSGRIWLYDTSKVEGGGMEGIEEIEFPKDLYENAKEGDSFVYEDGEYRKYMEE